MLEMNDVNKSFKKRQVLSGINIRLGQGIYALLGVNGAGKTTLIRILTGLLKPDGGAVTFHGKPIRKQKKLFHSRLGYMPQYATYYPGYSVYEFMEYMCVIKEIPGKVRKERIELVLREVNLWEERDKKIGALSGGMRQRVGIAQGIINEPEVIILDEPTAGLDPNERVRFRRLIKKVAAGRTVLIATHNVEDATRMADYAILLHNHQILVMDRPDVLVSNSEPAVKDLEEYFFMMTNGEVEEYV